jgi:hypothetical protein
MNDGGIAADNDPHEIRLGEIGLQHVAPYLMNRIMGGYNPSYVTILKLGPTTAHRAFG